MSSAPSTFTVKWDGKLLKGKHIVLINTQFGQIVVEVNADLAPKTATNFVVLAESGYFDGLTFHRVIPGFMIQGGDPNGDGTGGSSIFGKTFEDEINPNASVYKTGYVPGIVAMANAGPNTNGSQFFIMDGNTTLEPNYTIFGHVLNGQDVVSKIANVKRDASDKPLEPVTMRMRIRK
jgi:cyclophilin family peptidyl-prolyl cis-trans isomerase